MNAKIAALEAMLEEKDKAIDALVNEKCDMQVAFLREIEELRSQRNSYRTYWLQEQGKVESCISLITETIRDLAVDVVSIATHRERNKRLTSIIHGLQNFKPIPKDMDDIPF